MTGVDMKTLGTWEMKILRRVHGQVVQQGMWRMRTDKELRELYKNLDIVADIGKKRLELAGHVVRMDQGRTVKKIFESKQDGNRRRGRHRLRWVKDVEKDIRMKVN
jgi:hypothetical protein